MEFEDEDIFGIPRDKTSEKSPDFYINSSAIESANKPILSKQRKMEDSLDSALNIYEQEDESPERMKLSQSVIKIRPISESNPNAMKLGQQETGQSTDANKKSIEADDPYDRFRCIQCNQDFSSIHSKLPFQIPCSHNICSDCANVAESKRSELTCPRDNYFLQNLTTLKINDILLREVKLRERRLKNEELMQLRFRNGNAERVVQRANEETLKTSVQKILQASNNTTEIQSTKMTFDMLDGTKPDAEKMKQIKREEKKEFRGELIKMKGYDVPQNARELQQIQTLSKQENQQSKSKNFQQSLQKLQIDPFAQVDLKGFKPINSPSKLAVFTDTEASKPNEFVGKTQDELVQEQAQRRAHPSLQVTQLTSSTTVNSRLKQAKSELIIPTLAKELELPSRDRRKSISVSTEGSPYLKTKPSRTKTLQDSSSHREQSQDRISDARHSRQSPDKHSSRSHHSRAHSSHSRRSRHHGDDQSESHRSHHSRRREHRKREDIQPDRKQESPTKTKDPRQKRLEIPEQSRTEAKRADTAVPPKVGDRWRLDDYQVKKLIESKYNPEQTIINEQSHELSHSIVAPQVETSDAVKFETDFNTEKTAHEVEQNAEYTVAEYSVVGAGKKKKKKKVKRKIQPDSAGLAPQRLNSQTTNELPPKSVSNFNELESQATQSSLQFMPVKTFVDFQQESTNPFLDSQPRTAKVIDFKAHNYVPEDSDPDLANPINWRTQEQLQAAFRPFDFEHTGIISTSHCRLALRQCQGFLTREQETLISQMENETWSGDRTVNYKALILKIAKDPPGFIRTNIVLPRIEGVSTAQAIQTQKHNAFFEVEPKKASIFADQPYKFPLTATESQDQPPLHSSQSLPSLSQSQTTNRLQEVPSSHLPTVFPTRRGSILKNSITEPTLFPPPSQQQTRRKSVAFQQEGNDQPTIYKYTNSSDKCEPTEQAVSSKDPEAEEQSRFNDQLFTEELKQRLRGPEPFQFPPLVAGPDGRFLHQSRYATFSHLVTKCELHSEEVIRYYCRDCFRAVCSECVTAHSRHDFIAANNQAATELRQQHIKTEELVAERVNLYEKVLDRTEKKLVEMDSDSMMEFKKLTMAFTEIREALFRREIELKKELHVKINEAQQALKDDIAALQNVLQELKTLHVAASELKEAMQTTENTRGIVGAIKRIKLVKDDFSHLCNTVLAQNDPGAFIVNKQLQYHPAVPEFIYNSAEARLFIDKLGMINLRVDFPEIPSNSLGGLPGLQSLEPRHASHRSPILGGTYNPQIDAQEVSNLLMDEQQRDSNQVMGKMRQVATGQILTQLYQKQMPAQDSVYWPKWDTYDLYQFDFFRRTWQHYPDTRPSQRFLYFSSICHLPKNLGMFIIGGADADDNFSKRNTYFSRYQRFVEKAPMLFKRAFFPSIFNVSDSCIYVFGGSNGDHDLNHAERYSIVDNTWQQIAPMAMRRNGSSCVAFEKYIFVFGGNELDVGSLDSIEKYSIETDKWTIARVRLREPVHDTVAFNLGGSRVLIFGGSTNSQVNSHFDIYDLTCDLLGPTETKFEASKVFLPPVLDASSGQLHCYEGYGDSDLTHAKLNIKSLMCDCRDRGMQLVLPSQIGPDKKIVRTNSGKVLIMSRARTEMQNRRNIKTQPQIEQNSQRDEQAVDSGQQ